MSSQGPNIIPVNIGERMRARRQQLAIEMASRPEGVTSAQLREALFTDDQGAALNLLKSLERAGILFHEIAKSRKMQSPGKPPFVFRVGQKKGGADDGSDTDAGF